MVRKAGFPLGELVCANKQKANVIDIFSVLKNLNISKETKLCHHSCKQRAKISITTKFEEEIL